MATTKAVKELWKKVVLEGKNYDGLFRKVKIVSEGKGICTAELTIDQEHVNLLGNLHGGCTAGLVDLITTTALISATEGTHGVSVGMNISFLKTASLGKTIVMEGKASKVGKSLAFLDVVIKQKDTSDIIAIGSHTKFLPLKVM